MQFAVERQHVCMGRSLSGKAPRMSRAGSIACNRAMHEHCNFCASVHITV
jgi:hypothetical protein